MNPRNLLQLFVRAAKAWSDDYAPSMGAAISYYTVFSIAPLLVIVIAVAGAVFGRDAVSGQIVAQMRGLVGDQGAAVVQNIVAASSNTHKGLIAGIISAVVLVVGATSVFTELQSSLDRIWHVPESERATGLRSLVRDRLLSFGVILGLVFLLMVSLVLSAGLSAVGNWASDMLPGASVLLQLVNIALSLGVATLLFAFIFKVLPSTRIEWHDVWVGAFTTAVLFEIGKYLIGLYLGKSSTTQAFAAAGSLVVLIAWVYYAAQIFLLGAEFTKVYAHENGSRQGQPQAGEVQAVVPKAPVPAGGIPVPAKPASKEHHLPAAARLEHTRHQLEVEVPPRAAKLKKVAKGASAAAAGLVAVAVVATRLMRRQRAEPTASQRAVSAGQRTAAVLGRRTATLKQRTADLGQRTAALKQRTATLKQRTAAFGRRTASLARRTAALAQRANPLRKRRILRFGA